MTRAEWVEMMRTEFDRRIREYEEFPTMMKANGVVRLCLADSLAELAAANTLSLPVDGPPSAPPVPSADRPEPSEGAGGTEGRHGTERAGEGQ